MTKSLYIHTRDCGFFSSMLQIVDNLKYCDMQGFKPIIDLKPNFRYQFDEDDPWVNYFEPINDKVIEGDLISIDNISNEGLYLLENFILVNPSRYNFKGYIWELISNNSPEIYQNRMEVHKIISKYLKPNQFIKNEVSQFKMENFGGKMLGVHIRGTDFNFENNPDLSEYNIEKIIISIKKLILEHGYTKIYLASDNQESLDIITNEIPNSFFYKTDFRAEKFFNLLPSFKIFDQKDMVKQGQSVLIESILLSSCDGLLCINSGVSSFSAYLNPNMDIHLMTRIRTQG